MTSHTSEAPDGKIRRYWVYGLILNSEIPFPELVETDATTDAEEVIIRLDQIPDQENGWKSLGTHFRYAQNALVIQADADLQIGSFDAREIIVQVGPSPDWLMIRTHILGGGLATIKQQRGQLTFHVSAVDTPDGAWAFTGPSGAGKSTTAAMIAQDQGWPIITDDIADITVQDSIPIISGGVTKVKLWRDSLDMLGIENTRGQADTWRPEKRHLVTERPYCTEPRPLKKLFYLKDMPDDKIVPLSGFHKVDALAEAVFRNFTLGIFAAGKSVTPTVIQLANALDIYEVDVKQYKSAAEIHSAFTMQ